MVFAIVINENTGSGDQMTISPAFYCRRRRDAQTPLIPQLLNLSSFQQSFALCL